MYQHPLARLLIYTDKRDKSEFGIPKQAWYDLYELFTKTKYDNLDDGFTAVDFFNEVFYCLTFTYANEEAAEWLNDYINRESVLCPYVPELADPQSQKERKAAQDLQKKIEYTNWYVLAFVWVILNIQKELPPFVKIFMTALENKLHLEYQDFYLFEDFPEEHPDRYSFDFSLHPEFTEEILFHSTEDWRNATDDFDYLVVTHISQRFWDPDDRRNIIELIQNALAIENAKPKAEPRYSRISHRKKANQELLDNLLRDTEIDIEYKDNHPQQNITSLKRFSGNRIIDDLDLDYGNDGHQLLKVTDRGHNADLYSTIEYHNAAAQTDTTMFYDANGNLIRDLDRGIMAIRYNMLSLPDTIIFSNGGQIVNFYDATGQKYKSITYTNIASVIPQQYDFAHYSFETDSIEYLVTEYTGNIEKQYSKRDTTIRIHNAIGYYSDSTYYHYIKDHLGNVCAVVNANADTVVQRTMYYASGVPMAQSWGRDTQPYLYNGKEFIESHGWNTYDYGFRGYYATIGRFTTIDPLAEQTPWQSPYAYAGNNFINAIDWMGLSGMMSGYNLTGVNSSGVVVYHDYSGDPRVILVDEDWKEGDPITGLLVGWEIYGIPYKVGSRCDYLCLGGGSIFSGEFGTGMPNDGKKYIFSTSDYQKQSSNDSFSNGHWRYSISLIEGIAGSYKIGKYSLQLGVEIELGKFSHIVGTPLRSTDFTWPNKHNSALRVGFAYNNIGAYWEETFQLYDETWEYVPASTAYSYGLTFPNYISGTESNGNISISFALCALLGVSITIDYQGQ